jgi:hypothetical protein
MGDILTLDFSAKVRANLKLKTNINCSVYKGDCPLFNTLDIKQKFLVL